MALRTIRMLGDPVLNKVCREVKEVTPKISTLISDMLETMYDANGVGRHTDCWGRLLKPARQSRAGYKAKPRGCTGL